MAVELLDQIYFLNLIILACIIAIVVGIKRIYGLEKKITALESSILRIEKKLLRKK